MSDSSARNSELFELLARLSEEILTEAEAIQLRQLLIADASARRIYRHYMALVSGLCWECTDPARIGGHQFAQQPPAVKHPSTAVLSVSGRGAGTLNRPLVWSILVVAVAFYGTFALFSWNLRPEKSPSRADGSGSTVATISGAADVHWAEGKVSKPRDSIVSQGELLKIDSGILELQLKQGVTLRVEAPAEWSIDGENSATLSSGKLVAQVSTRAIGFTVNTPTTRIVDLGTEFGVAVAADGTTDVHVLQGRVELNDVTDSKAPTPSKRQLSAGESMRVAAGSRQAFHIPFDGSHAFSALRSAASLKQSASSGEAINTIWLGNLFDDPRSTPLAEAVETDTFCAVAEIEDLGVERVLHGGDSLKQIAPQVWFDVKNLGWDAAILGEVSNDAWSVIDGHPMGGIRTRGTWIIPTEPKIEEGIGVLLDTLITFDLDEIRAAGGPQQGRQFEFVCDRAGINDDCAGDERASVQMVVLVSNARGVQTASVNGVAANVADDARVWSITSPIGKPLRADGRFVQFRVAIPVDAKYLTLLATSAGDGGFADHAVWSGARLEVQK